MEEDLDTILNSINNSYSKKLEKYRKLQDVLDKESTLVVGIIKKIIVVTTKDLLKDNLKFAKHILHIWLQILKEFELEDEEKVILEQALIDSAIMNMKLLDEVSPNNIFDDLKELSYDVMKSYPKEIIIDITSKNHRLQLYSLIATILNTKCAVSISRDFFKDEDLKIDIMIFDILKNVIEVLPPEKRQEFMEGGLHVWFSYIIPYAFALMICDKLKSNPVFVEVLDLITRELDEIDFRSNKEWQKILACISRPSGYPALMMTSLENKSDNWVIMLCVIVKLLKNNITNGMPGQELHINCILPVLENAFKMNVADRCGAFHCWKLIAKCFASAKYEQKKLEFLMIPLETNNVKVEEVAVAKFHCWWHIINCFQTKLVFCKYSLLMKFIKYCFGQTKILVPKEHSISSSIYQYKKVIKLGMEAFLNVIGHGSHCEGCIINTIPLLESKILNGEILKSYLFDWLEHLKGATIVLAYSEDICEAKKQAACVWESFFNVIELEKNKNELICALLKKSLEILQENEKTSELIFHAIFRMLYTNNEIERSIVGQIKANNVLSRPISLIIDLATHPQYYNYIISDEKTSKEKLSHMLKFAFKFKCDTFINHLLLRSPHSAQTAILWESIADYICDNNVNISCYSDILKWPFQKIMRFSDELLAANNWERLYNYLKANFTVMKDKDIEAEIFVLLSSYKKHRMFTIIVLCNIMKYSDRHLIPKQIEMLHEMVTMEKNLQPVIQVFNETLNSIVKDLGDNDDIATTKCTMASINIMLKFMYESQTPNNDFVDVAMNNMLNNINNLIKKKNYSQFSSLISETISKIGASNMVETCVKLSQRILEVIVKDIICGDSGNNKEVDNVVAPMARTVDKNYLNKENSSDYVAKVIVQNGEDVLVVDSNKKFNPRKLTEHQKEVMQRKRDDIPALYVDLSQSQDEFKNKYWVSIDQSDTSKDSEMNNLSKEDTNNAEGIKNEGNDLAVTVKPDSNTLIPPIETPSTKTKQRLPFKERVMLNIKNLLHKGNMTTDPETGFNDGDVTTPNKPTEIRSEIVNSAPAGIRTYRPSRLKRKPKKYELDYEQLTTPKKRNVIANKETDTEVKKMRNGAKEDLHGLSVNNNKSSPLKNINNEKHDKIEDKGSIRSNEARKVEGSADTQDNDDDEHKTRSVESINKDYEISQFKEVAVLIERTPLSYMTPKSEKTVTNSKSTGKKDVQTKLLKKLGIDMVNGNPFLEEPIQSRRTRRVSQDSVTKTKKNVNKNSATKINTKNTSNKKLKLDQLGTDVNDVTFESSISSDTSNHLPSSEDFIESSQATALSIVSTTRRRRSCSVKSSNDLTANVSKIILPTSEINVTATMDTEPLIDVENIIDNNKSENKINSNDDTAGMETQSLVISQYISEKSNLTATDITASIDTEPLPSIELVAISEDPTIQSESPEKSVVGSETQEIAEANTEPIDPSICNRTAELDTTITINGDDVNDSLSCLSSPFKDEHQRNEIFLNNTLNISPIQTMKAKHDEERTPEKSEDFVIIKLSSPVRSNGEPIYEHDSPEIFTNDKISPSKAEQSPSKAVEPLVNMSPSLKKNRLQVRPSGRAAQILNLCQTDKRNTVINNEKINEETKKVPLTPAKRNLQMFYNMNSENTTNENSDTGCNKKFLKLKRPLPSADSSPIGPILKRKLENNYDTPVSPASKKKRVSFHDPPVSNTIAVQKYIEVNGERSPQSTKRHDRSQRRSMKSPRQLESSFKSSAGLKMIESMNDVEIIPLDPVGSNYTSWKLNDDTMMSDIDMNQTPQLKVVHIHELNDEGPIFPELINNIDPIDSIVTELTSPTKMLLLLKELGGKINTIGDFARLPELEVNQLSIKAPKVEVAKKVLADHLAKTSQRTDLNEPIENNDSSIWIASVNSTKVFVEAEVQCDSVMTKSKTIQTDVNVLRDMSVQSKESSFVSTNEFINLAMEERPDFIKKVLKTKEILNTLSLESVVELLQNKITTDSDRKSVLDLILSQKNGIATLQRYLCDNLSSANIVNLCSELLNKVHMKMKE